MKDKIEALTNELEEVKTVRDKFEGDLEQTLQQLTEVKTTVADLKAQNDEATGHIEEFTAQNKVCCLLLVQYQMHQSAFIRH